MATKDGGPARSAEVNYWYECVSIALEECGATLTHEQIDEVAESVRGGHDNYGMAFYSPPASDRLNSIESEWKARLARLQQEYDEYRSNAETAVRKALRQNPDALVSIGEYGEVLRHNGRTVVIQ